MWFPVKSDTRFLNITELQRTIVYKYYGIASDNKFSSTTHMDELTRILCGLTAKIQHNCSIKYLLLL